MTYPFDRVVGLIRMLSAVLLRQAEMLIGADQAEECVGRALSWWFSLAARGYEAQYGPLALLYELFGSALHPPLIRRSGVALDTPMLVPGDISDREVQAVCWLYTHCYQVVKLGHLSPNEIDHISLQIMMFEWKHLENLTWDGMINSLYVSSPPLAAALQLTRDHDCQGELICENGMRMFVDGETRSHNWLALYGPYSELA